MSVFLTLTNRAVLTHHKDSKDGDLTTLVRVAFPRHSLICILVLKPEFPEKLKGIKMFRYTKVSIRGRLRPKPYGI